jgi:hypothetical protein
VIKKRKKGQGKHNFWNGRGRWGRRTTVSYNERLTSPKGTPVWHMPQGPGFIPRNRYFRPGPRYLRTNSVCGTIAWHSGLDTCVTFVPLKSSSARAADSSNSISRNRSAKLSFSHTLVSGPSCAGVRCSSRTGSETGGRCGATGPTPFAPAQAQPAPEKAEGMNSVGSIQRPILVGPLED